MHLVKKAIYMIFHINLNRHDISQLYYLLRKSRNREMKQLKRNIHSKLRAKLQNNVFKRQWSLEMTMALLTYSKRAEKDGLEVPKVIILID